MRKIGTTLVLAVILSGVACMSDDNSEKGVVLIDIQQTAENIRHHLTALTVEIGERSIYFPDHLKSTADYIQSFYSSLGLVVQTEPYRYHRLQVANVISEIVFTPLPSKRYLLGAHYDSVDGTVGADDNASAIAVQLEVARNLSALHGTEPLDLAVKLVSFALEEPPVFGTRYMGSKVHAAAARRRKEKIDGMLCLEMVGYSCHQPGCQRYPLPLALFNYPKQGNFIGIVGNFSSRRLTNAIHRAFQKSAELPAIKLTVPLAGWLMPPVRLSDHASFWDQGFKAVMITDTAFYRNPHYHTDSDTMEQLDYQFMAQLVNSLVIFFRCCGQ